MGDQIVTHGQFGPEVLNRVIGDCESLAIWNIDALQGNPEKLPFNVAPLSDGGTEFMFEGDDFLGNVHGARTKPPNAKVSGAGTASAGLTGVRPAWARCNGVEVPCGSADMDS